MYDLIKLMLEHLPTVLKAIAGHFGKYTSSLSGGELDEIINTPLVSCLSSKYEATASSRLP